MARPYRPTLPLAAGGGGAPRGRRADRAALARTFAELHPRMLAVAQRITRHADAAGDVVQSAFEKALRGAAGFRGEARVSTWLHRIVVNEALMWQRTERRRRERGLSEPGEGLEAPAPGPSPLDQAIAREGARRVADALAGLAGEEREVLVQCGLEGMAYREYGQRLGLHPSAVKSRAFRARARLRAHLEDDPEVG